MSQGPIQFLADVAAARQILSQHNIKIDHAQAVMGDGQTIADSIGYEVDGCRLIHLGKADRHYYALVSQSNVVYLARNGESLYLIGVDMVPVRLLALV